MDHRVDHLRAEDVGVSSMVHYPISFPEHIVAVEFGLLFAIGAA
jgi:hypothetical protein